MNSFDTMEVGVAKTTCHSFVGGNAKVDHIYFFVFRKPSLAMDSCTVSLFDHIQLKTLLMPSYVFFHFLFKGLFTLR